RQVDGPTPGRGRRRAGRQAHAGPAPVPDPRTGPAGPAMAGPEADRTRLPDRPLDGPPRRRVDPPPVRRGIPSALPPALPHRPPHGGYPPSHATGRPRQRNDATIPHWVANDWPRIQKKPATPTPTSS